MNLETSHLLEISYLKNLKKSIENRIYQLENVDMKFTHQPMKTCKLRTVGLASVQGAKFGMTRNNGTRAHQGVDLATDEGYRLYAVENGEIVGINKGSNGYGYTVTLKMETENRLNGLFAFYAHCDRIDVSIGQKVKAGQQIALSGDTGNASGMSTEDKGGHLHFEVRERAVCGLGLKYRIDPLPFIELTK